VLQKNYIETIMIHAGEPVNENRIQEKFQMLFVAEIFGLRLNARSNDSRAEAYGYLFVQKFLRGSCYFSTH